MNNIENDTFNMIIDKELKTKFKMKCVEEHTTMSEVLIKYISEYVKK